MTNEEVKRAIAALPAEAVGVCYVGPRKHAPVGVFIRQILLIGEGSILYRNYNLSTGESTDDSSCSRGYIPSSWAFREATREEKARLHKGKSHAEHDDRLQANLALYARQALSNPHIITDGMLLAEVERRGLGLTGGRRPV
jgi:hypothetical protein